MIALEKTGNVPCFSIKQTSSSLGKASIKHRKVFIPYGYEVTRKFSSALLSGSRAVFLLLSLELSPYDFFSHS